MYNYKKLFIAAAILFLISFSALVTVLIGTSVFVAPPADSFTYGRGFSYIRTHLGFNYAQQLVYDSLLNEYQNRTAHMKSLLSESQFSMLEEIAKSKPDTLILRQISEEACAIQSLIRQHTFRHLIEVSQIATEEQKEGLKLLYQEMLTDSKTRHGQQQGKSRRPARNRHGRNL
ncbi:MAG: hypothetical protein Q7V19_03340 [Bacteroidales bacterium]|nr:hypothetical protein [Bacteroidales bacterium]